jgi:hypothetical protein
MHRMAASGHKYFGTIIGHWPSIGCRTAAVTPDGLRSAATPLGLVSTDLLKIRTALVGISYSIRAVLHLYARERTNASAINRRKPLSATTKLPRHLIASQSGGLRFRQPAAASQRASCEQALFRKIHRNERLTMAGGHSATNRALPTSARRRSLTTKVVEGCLCPVSFLLSRGQLADGES